MKEVVSKRIEDLIRRYRTTTGREKQILRNRLFKLLQPQLIACIKGVYKDRGMYGSDEEILSTSWDCFQKGLATYRRGSTTVKMHFRDACFNHIRWTVRKGGKLRESSLNVNIVDSLYKSEPLQIMDGMFLLQEFRNALDECYRGVFDEALDSFKTMQVTRDPKILHTVRSNKNRYGEALRCFRMMIEFMVRRH